MHHVLRTFSYVLVFSICLLAFPLSLRASGQFILGAWYNQSDLGAQTLEQYEQELGVFFNSHKMYRNWNEPFPAGWAEAMQAQGRKPEFTWQPWENGVGIAFGSIANGTHDVYIQSVANTIKSIPFTVQIAIAPEMNGWWSPWAIDGTPGRTNLDFIAGHRRIVDIFNQNGATNVEWIWAPNVVEPGGQQRYQFRELYPGDAYVTYMGLDGYNWGDYWGPPNINWQSFQEVFGYSYGELTAISGKNILIMEVASTEGGGDKAAWIREMFSQLPNFPKIRGFTWFNRNRETDWRIHSSASSKLAFKEAAAIWLPILNGTHPTATPLSTSASGTRATPTPASTPQAEPNNQQGAAEAAQSSPSNQTSPGLNTERQPLAPVFTTDSPTTPAVSEAQNITATVSKSVSDFWRSSSSNAGLLVVLIASILYALAVLLTPRIRHKILYSLKMFFHVPK